MADHDLTTLLDWRGRTVLDRKGETIGKLGDLYLDEATDQAAYAGVRTGLFGRYESIVPLARVTERDGDLVVPYDSELVRDAPNIDPDASLDDAEQERLARHYGTARAAPPEDAGDDGDGDDGAEMVRSEEEVVTGTTEMRPAERVRLRKVLVTDHVRKTVPVRREEIRLETDPPPEGTIERVDDAGPAADAP
ncbi:PRC-barrel domain-containing protein [Conexibacter woesei]|uniref:PRC-barrel domain-containing protein n=1 Tax=Conexibacter woesei TaxID=191495 RepID=UPI0004078761|nr:PRC-barrel domain-containing protein [Conexibacter woesei]